VRFTPRVRIRIRIRVRLFQRTRVWTCFCTAGRSLVQCSRGIVNSSLGTRTCYCSSEPLGEEDEESGKARRVFNAADIAFLLQLCVATLRLQSIYREQIALDRVCNEHTRKRSSRRAGKLICPAESHAARQQRKAPRWGSKD
jgi:hypothetical protein